MTVSFSFRLAVLVGTPAFAAVALTVSVAGEAAGGREAEAVTVVTIGTFWAVPVVGLTGIGACLGRAGSSSSQGRGVPPSGEYGTQEERTERHRSWSPWPGSDKRTNRNRKNTVGIAIGAIATLVQNVTTCYSE
jgi:hypothetical protein